MGVSKIDNVLMILGVSRLMKEKEREIITRELIRGFNDSCEEAETKVTGGQSVMNPWPMIGGTAITVAKTKEIIFPNNAKPGDKLILTKPLGTQVVVNSVDWYRNKNEKYEKLLKLNISESDLWDMHSKALESMMRLNRNASRLMQKYSASSATDITGFGFKGHLLNLCLAQKEKVNFRIDSIPIIKNTDIINKEIQDFKLLTGFSPETSGGLLLSIKNENALSYIEEMKNFGELAWIVGEVEESMTSTQDVIFSSKLDINLV